MIKVGRLIVRVPTRVPGRSGSWSFGAGVAVTGIAVAVDGRCVGGTGVVVSMGAGGCVPDTGMALAAWIAIEVEARVGAAAVGETGAPPHPSKRAESRNVRRWSFTRVYVGQLISAPPRQVLVNARGDFDLMRIAIIALFFFIRVWQSCNGEVNYI